MVELALLLLATAPDAGSDCVTFAAVKPQLDAYRAANRAAFVLAAADAGLAAGSLETLPPVTELTGGPFVKEGAVQELAGKRTLAGPVGQRVSYLGPGPLLAMRDSKNRLRVVTMSPTEGGEANATLLSFCGCFSECAPRLFVEMPWSDTAAADGCRLAGGARVPPESVQHFFALPPDAEVGPPVVLRFPLRRLKAEDAGRHRICPTPP